MIKCLICSKSFDNKKEFGYHILHHKMKMNEYKTKFNLHKYCKICGCTLPEYNISGFCNNHRDRTGVNNPFFGKQHKKETIDKAKIKCKEYTKKLWQNNTYREAVIANATGKTRSDKFKKEQSERVSQWYKNNPVQLEIRSNAMKKNWESGKIIQGCMTSINRSHAENILYEEINKFYNTITRPCLTIEGRKHYPDIFVPDLNLIIEYYGDYWHANPKYYESTDIVHHSITAQKIWDKDQERIRRLQTLYTVNIIWEDDFKTNKEKILFDIDSCLNWDSCSF